MTENPKSHWFHSQPELWEKLKPLAREMRQTPTPAEDALWQRLRNRRVKNAKFRRQYGIERFVVDFVCVDTKLIIEVDGEIHDSQQELDEIRQAYLEALGFHVLRFRNEQILTEIEGVVTEIAEALAEQKADLTRAV